MHHIILFRQHLDRFTYLVRIEINIIKYINKTINALGCFNCCTR